MNFPDDCLRALVRGNYQITVRLCEHGARDYRRLEMPVCAGWVKADNLALWIYAVNVGPVCGRQRGELGARRLPDIRLAEIDASGKSFCVHERDGALIRIKAKHFLDRRNFV